MHKGLEFTTRVILDFKLPIALNKISRYQDGVLKRTLANCYSGLVRFSDATVT